MAFMMGMYDVDRSGDTERMRIRGSDARSDEGVDAPGEIRLMSGNGQRRPAWRGGRTHSRAPL